MLQFLVIALYAGIIYLIQKPYSKRMLESSSLKEAVKTRTQFKRIRTASLLIFFILNFVYGYFVQRYENGTTNYVSIASTAFIVTFMGHIVGQGFESFSQFNPISLLVIEDIYKSKKRFSLYLRGFEKDNYKSLQEASYADGQTFSEFNLTRLLSKSIPTYAVGMTKELTSPHGALRIYLDDQTWKSGVEYLMDRASSIFILMNEKESCLWEIEQSSRLLDKTCFIVDDPIQYDNIRIKLCNKINFPIFDFEKIQLPFCFRLVECPYQVSIEGTTTEDKIIAIVYTFENNQKGYKKLIRELYGLKRL